MLYFGRKNSGFTLLEILITMAIMAILTVIIFTDYAANKKIGDIKGAADTVQVLMQEIQNNAQTGIAPGGLLPTGYGLQLTVNSNQLIEFYKTAGTSVTYVSGVDPNPKTAQLLSWIKVHRFVIITPMIPTGDPAGNKTAGQLDVFFSTPDAKPTITYTNGVTADATVKTAQIVLHSDQTNLCYAITITKATGIGMISKRQQISCD